MIRRIALGTALVAFAASAASAQTTAKFKFSSAGSNFNSYRGTFTAGAPNSGNFQNNSSFQIWCVDEAHETPMNQKYDVYVSQLSGNLSKTRIKDQDTYRKAAYLASQMTNSNSKASQYAMWAILHSKTSVCTPFGGSGYLSGCHYNDVNDLVDEAGINYTGINASDWYVITDKNPDKAKTCKHRDSKGHCTEWKGGYDGMQEVIASCQEGGRNAKACDPWDPPSETGENPTPEPATMTLLAMGLAGMAGSSLRRRRRS